MGIEDLGQDPISVDYELQADDLPAYAVCSSLYVNHLKSLAPETRATRSLVMRLGLKVLALGIMFVVAVIVFIGLFEAGYPLDLLSSSNYPIYGFIAVIGVLSSVQLIVRHRALRKALYSVYSADPFSVRLGLSGFSVKTKRMDASYSWDAEACRVIVWKKYILILHSNTMLILPERVFAHPMSALVGKIEEWQTKTA